MKKLFSCLFFVIFIIGLFSVSNNDLKKIEAAECTNGGGIIFNKYVSGPYKGTSADISTNPALDGGNIKLSSADTKVIITANLKLDRNCFTDGKTLRKFKSSISTAKYFYESTILNPTNEEISITAQIGPNACEKIAGVAQYHCLVTVRFVEVDNNEKNIGGVLIFEPLDFIIAFANPSFEDSFKKTETKISWNGAGIVPNKGDCRRIDHNAEAYLGNQPAPDYTYTIDASGKMPPDAFIQYNFTTENCSGVSAVIDTYLIAKRYDKYDHIIGIPDSDKLLIIRKGVVINQSKNYIRLIPPPFFEHNDGTFFDTDLCIETISDSKYVTYECVVTFDSSQGEISIPWFSWEIMSFWYKVKVPLALKNKVTITPKVESNLETGAGVNLGQFGATGIKEGFSWDPCYSPVSKKQITYLPSADGTLDVSDFTKGVALDDKRVTPATAECYTLLSNLPIKLASSDAVSKQIGYAPARGQNNQVIPGLVKTVIVGNFFIGDFILYLFRLLVGVIGLIAVAVLIYIGFAIATNKENPAQLKELKAWLGRVFGAITIILGSYLILSIIDPKLTDFGFGVGSGFNLSEQGFKYDQLVNEAIKNGGVSGFNGSAVSTDKTCNPKGLSNAKLLEQSEENTKNGNFVDVAKTYGLSVKSGQYLEKRYAEKLDTLIDLLESSGIKGIYLRSLYPTSSVHQSVCHLTGLTVDLNMDPSQEDKAEFVYIVLKISALNGFRAVYERTGNDSVLQSVINYSASQGKKMAWGLDYYHGGGDPNVVSGPHFSLYLNQ